jgi:hypothetical protein
MTIIVVAEDGSGLPDANSYIDSTFADTYHADRGNAYWDALDADAKSACLIRATDYIDKRFTRNFRGFRMQKDQALAWPRLAAYDDDRFALTDVPAKLQKATAEYALRAAIYNVLAPDPIRPVPMQNMRSAVDAFAVFLFTGNALDGQTVTIGTTVYAFETGALDAAYKVLVGATPSASLDNLIAAINGDTGIGVTYAAGTVAHPNVTAVAGSGDSMVVTAKLAGILGNTIATTDTATNGSWDAATLTGGTVGDPNGSPEIIAGPVRSKTVKVGPVEKITTYDTPAQYRRGAAGGVDSRMVESNLVNDWYIPMYPEADLLIENLIDTGFSVSLERA